MIFLFFLLLLTPISSYGNSRHELQQHIYNNVPRVIPDRGINLTLSLAIRAFNSIDQIDGSINMNVWFRYNFNNKNIVWNPKDYSNITTINLDTNIDFDNYIWTPDIYLYNTAEKPMSELDYSKANVYSNGDIFWSRPGLIKSTCIFDLTYFPFDQQKCKLKFGSWAYDKTMIFLGNHTSEVDISNYQEHEEWKLVGHDVKINSVKYSCCENEYHDIDFHYTIRRKPNYYNLNIIIPTFATATLIILTLLVPWDSGERISFAVTVLLSIIVFLLIVSENLPKTDNEPLLSRMIIRLIYFSLVGVIFTIIISCLHNNINNKSILKSKFLKNLFSKIKFIECCLNKNSALEKRTDSYNEAVHGKTYEDAQLEECRSLLILIEKIFIVAFFISFTIYCLFVFFSVPSY